MSRFLFLFGLFAITWTPCLVRAAGPMCVHIGGEVRPLSRKACARKAIEIMARDKFVRAQIMPDGNVLGWTVKASVLVLAFPHPDGSQVLVLAASTDGAEAERLRNLVRAHVFDAPYNPDGPRSVKTDDSGPAVALDWKITRQQQSPLLRFFEQVATIVLEKHGFVVSSLGKNFSFGVTPRSAVGLFAFNGQNGHTMYLGAVTACDASDATRKDPRTYLSALLKILYH